MTTDLPPSRTLPLPQQRVLEALGADLCVWHADLSPHQRAAMYELEARGCATVHRDSWVITDKGARYLAVLGVTPPR